MVVLYVREFQMGSFKIHPNVAWQLSDKAIIRHTYLPIENVT